MIRTMYRECQPASHLAETARPIAGSPERAEIPGSRPPRSRPWFMPITPRKRLFAFLFRATHCHSRTTQTRARRCARSTSELRLKLRPPLFMGFAMDPMIPCDYDISGYIVPECDRDVVSISTSAWCSATMHTVVNRLIFLTIQEYLFRFKCSAAGLPAFKRRSHEIEYYSVPGVGYLGPN